jgi:UDP-N-acetylglucosamine 2-epimerase
MTLYELSQKLGLKISTPCALVTFHPETMNKINPVEQIEIILSVCQRFPQIQFFFTKSNADEFGQQINDFLEIKLKTLSNVFLFDSLGTSGCSSGGCLKFIIVFFIPYCYRRIF